MFMTLFMVLVLLVGVSGCLGGDDSEDKDLDNPLDVKEGEEFDPMSDTEGEEEADSS
jgi:hypothetical protein